MEANALEPILPGGRAESGEHVVARASAQWIRVSFPPSPPEAVDSSALDARLGVAPLEIPPLGPSAARASSTMHGIASSAHGWTSSRSVIWSTYFDRGPLEG
jgi:hypothetical protein